jgi:hypothetical protein
MKRRFRLILPMDFGDGKIREVGETVEMDAEAAKDYAHGLIGEEEKGDGGNE